MTKTYAVTLRRQWTDKLQLRCLVDELLPGVRFTVTSKEVQLESSELGDLDEAVNKIKDSVIRQVVSSSRSSKTESAGSGATEKTAHNNLEMDHEMDEGQKMSNLNDDKPVDSGPGSAEDDSGKTVALNVRKEVFQKEQKQKVHGLQNRVKARHPVPAHDGARLHRQRSPTEGSRPGGNDSRDETESVKSRSAPAAESAPTRVSDDEQGTQAGDGDTESCEGPHAAAIKEQSRQSQYIASGNNISSSDDVLATIASQRQKEKKKYLMDESLWAYIQFIDPQSKWDEKLSSVFVDQGNEKLQLAGSTTDIDKLKKFCDTNRLQRAVVRKIQLVPSGCTSVEVFRNQLVELSQSRVLVRQIGLDLHYCELVGKNSDVVELEKAILGHYPKPVENTKITDFRQSTMLAGHLSASSVTSSSPEANTVPRATAAAATAAATETNFSHGSDQMHARVVEQMLGAELNFQTALAQLTVRVVTGDLLKWPCEVLVDSCDTELSHSGGLARSCAKAAGSKMRAECDAYKRERGSLPQCGVMDTTAGNIQPPAHRLIHACGPNSRSCRGLDECVTMLEMTFMNCLLYANDMLRARSIALPAISSGTSLDF